MFSVSRFCHFLCVPLAAMVLSACTANFSSVPPAAELPNKGLPALVDYRIQPGDTLEIKFFYTKDLNDTVIVRPDGKISLQLVDDVKAADLTPAELDADLTDFYADALKEDVDISVIVRTFGDQRIYVAGEVGQAGEYALKNRMSVMQAVAAAGGLRTTAKKDTVVVVRQADMGPPSLFRVNMTDGSIIDSATHKSYASLQPRDIVYVPRSGIATANLFMDQYVRQLLMFNGLNAGVTGIYQINDVTNTVVNE